MPDWKQEIRKRLVAARLEAAREAEIVDELSDHFDDRYADLIARGASAEDARQAVVEELREATLTAADLRRSGRPPAPEPVPAGAPAGRFAVDLLADVRYAARALRKRPGFALAVTVTLGLGIGANTAAFTLVNTLLLNPMPVVDQSALVSVHTVDTKSAGGTESLWPLSFPNLEDLQQGNAAFSSLAAYTSVTPLTWMNGRTSERIFAEVVTANYFDTLGLKPVRGRFFLPEEGRAAGGHPVLVMGFAPWQHRFGGASDIVGRTLVLNGATFTIVGVAPERFHGVTALFGPDVWIPSTMAEQVLPAEQRRSLTNREALVFRGLARLRPGVSRAQAEASLRAIAAELEREHPDENRGRSVALRPLSDAAFTGFGRPTALLGSGLLMGIVGLVLLISCSNVANLLLARAAARRQEIALRLALGAGRARLVRQLLTEAVLLALAGGALGTALAVAGTRVLTSFLPADVTLNFVELRLDARVLGFTLVLSVLTGLVFGLAPAWQSSRVDVVEGLKEEGRSAGPSRRRVGLRGALLVGQVAFSLIALVTAGLFLRSMERAYDIDPGFDTKRGGILLISPGQAGYDRPRSEQLYLEARARVSALPGVEAMTWATNLPFWARLSRGVLIEGQPAAQDAKGAMTLVNTVDLAYFETTGIALSAGRDLSETDVETSVPVAIVNEAFARRHWPGRDPLLERFRFAGEERIRQVVGVARNANYQALGEAAQPCVYLPLRQNFSDAVVLYVRTRGDPPPVLAEVQREIRGLDPALWVGDVRTLAKVLDQALFGARMGAGLLGVFGLLALGLASIGLYGVLAYLVRLRRREVGVRMALGANGRSIVALILRQGIGLVAMGVVLGLVGSLLVGRALSSLLYGLSPADPVSLAGATAVLLAVATLACYLPAQDASRVDPWWPCAKRDADASARRRRGFHDGTPARTSSGTGRALFLRDGANQEDSLIVSLDPVFARRPQDPVEAARQGLFRVGRQHSLDPGQAELGVPSIRDLGEPVADDGQDVTAVELETPRLESLGLEDPQGRRSPSRTTSRVARRQWRIGRWPASP
jgi:predicted permease